VAGSGPRTAEVATDLQHSDVPLNLFKLLLIIEESLCLHMDVPSILLASAYKQNWWHFGSLSSSAKKKKKVL